MFHRNSTPQYIFSVQLGTLRKPLHTQMLSYNLVGAVGFGVVECILFSCVYAIITCVKT